MARSSTADARTGCARTSFASSDRITNTVDSANRRRERRPPGLYDSHLRAGLGDDAAAGRAGPVASGGRRRDELYEYRRVARAVWPDRVPRTHVRAARARVSQVQIGLRTRSIPQTVGENVGRPDCTIPTCGLDWVTTPQPVVLDQWPAAVEEGTSFTSIGAWRGPYGPIEYRGRTYGLRAHEFRKFRSDYEHGRFRKPSARTSAARTVRFPPAGWTG